MKYCSLDEAFNNSVSYANCDTQMNYGPENMTEPVEKYASTYGYNNQDLSYKSHYDDPYPEADNEVKKYSMAKNRGVCENYRFHYANCPECSKLFKRQNSSKLIEHFNEPGKNNIVIILLILLLIWIIVKK